MDGHFRTTYISFIFCSFVQWFPSMKQHVIIVSHLFLQVFLSYLFHQSYACWLVTFCFHYIVHESNEKVSINVIKLLRAVQQCCILTNYKSIETVSHISINAHMSPYLSIKNIMGQCVCQHEDLCNKETILKTMI